MLVQAKAPPRGWIAASRRLRRRSSGPSPCPACPRRTACRCRAAWSGSAGRRAACRSCAADALGSRQAVHGEAHGEFGALAGMPADQRRAASFSTFTAPAISCASGRPSSFAGRTARSTIASAVCGSPPMAKMSPRLWLAATWPNTIRVVDERAEIIDAVQHDLARRHRDQRGIVGRIESDQDVRAVERHEAGRARDRVPCCRPWRRSRRSASRSAEISRDRRGIGETRAAPAAPRLAPSPAARCICA